MRGYGRSEEDTRNPYFHRNVKYIIKHLLESFGMQSSDYVASQVIRKERDFVRDKKRMPTPMDTLGILSMYFNEEQWDTFSNFIGTCLGVFIDTDEEDAGKVFCQVLVNANDNEVFGFYYDECKDMDLGLALIYK